MKKYLLGLVALVFVFTVPATSFAAGRLVVTKEDFHVVEEYRPHAYAFARVENAGDRPIAINAGLLEVYDENGDPVTSTDRLYKYAQYLQPDEYTYVKIYTKLEDHINPDIIDDHLLTVTAKSERSKTTLRLPCTSEFKQGVGNDYFTRDFMYAVVTNDTDQPLADVAVVLVLLDEEDNILYVDSNELGYQQRLMPNSSIEFAVALRGEWIDYFEENSMKPAKVDAIAYVNLDH